MYSDRVKYQIYHNKMYYDVNESIDWKTDYVDTVRHLEYHGIFSDVSKDITFTGDAAILLNNIYENEGVQSNVKLIRKLRHQLTDKWVIDYSLAVDFTERIKNKTSVKVKLNSGGLNDLIKSRADNDVEIEKLEDMDGKILSPINFVDLYASGRRIYLVSKDIKQDNEQFTDLKRYRVYREDRSEKLKVALLCKLTNQSDDHFHAQLEETSESEYIAPEYEVVIYKPGNPSTNMMFYADSLNAVDKLVKINVKQQLKYISEFLADGINLVLRLYKYSDAENYNSETLLYESQEYNLARYGDFVNIDIQHELMVSMLAHDSLSLVYYMCFDNGTSATFADSEIYSITENIDITVEEDSYFEPTTFKGVFVHEFLDRFVNMIGGNKIYSNYLGRTDIGYASNGKLSKTILTNGMRIRGFSEEDEKYKKITSSLRDCLDSINVIGNIGVTIEKNKEKEWLRVEDREYFYQKFIGISIGQVNDLVIQNDKSKFYSSIVIGYDKPSGDSLYEEAMGLDEYNTTTTWNTLITVIKNTLTLKSKYRTDPYGSEFARRKQKLSFPTTDTRYDDDIFLFDVESTSQENVFRLSKWEDDLDELPIGTFSPETAFNLMFTPVRLLYKHSRFILSGLKKYPNSYVRYLSSLGNSNLSTKKDGLVLKENENILVKDMLRPINGTDIATFTYPVDYSVIEQINGYTNNVSNLYGYIEFIDDNGKKQYGYVLEISRSENKFKVLM